MKTIENSLRNYTIEPKTAKVQAAYLDIMSLFWDDDHLEKYSLYGGRLWIPKSSVDFILFSFPVSCHHCSEKNISLRQQLYNDDNLNSIC